MNLDRLREARWRSPFVPFTIRLSNGHFERDENPDAVAIGRKMAIVVRDDSWWVHLKPRQILSLEFDST
jgi:hypothetical protein